MKQSLRLLCTAMLFLAVTPMFSQISNDNEDEVNKVNERQIHAFVPGQAIVKFKDESSIQVQKNAQARFRAANINTVDKILRDFEVNDMEKLFPTATPKSQSQLRRKAAPNGQIVQESNLDKVFWVKTGIQSLDSTMQMIKRLQELPEVEYAEPNYYAYITADMPVEIPQSNLQTEEQKVRKVPVSIETTESVICPNPSNNPLYDTYQYGIKQQNIHQLWNKPIINKKRPVIAILDTGIDINHPDLIDNIWTNAKEADGESAYDDDSNGIVDDVHGWNFAEDYYDLTDHNGHGTHCAGIAAAVDNAIGIVGANPLALIMPVKVLTDKGEGDFATIARGIVYAVENGADIISMSFGASILSNALTDAINNAYQTSILIASAGNNGVDIYDRLHGGTLYPAAYFHVLGVEACGQNLQRASYSNYDPDGPFYSEDGIDGRNYEIQVPGDKIYSTLPNGKYDKLSGTSMSAPLLAGAISALLMVKDYPNKDVLYGDLINLKADFGKIYSDDTPRKPHIDLVALEIDDNVEGNNNIDKQVDVGEIILFSPVLRNTWVDATGIQIKLSVDNQYNSLVNIVNPEVNFGYSLSSYAKATAQTPIQVRFADNISNKTRIKFTLEVTYHESAESYAQDVYVTINNMVKIGGLISENRTLTADHVYYADDNIGILEGVTLTIEPGTRIEFKQGKRLISFGKLVANGVPGAPIVFTSNESWGGIKSPYTSTSTNSNLCDTICYCIIENFRPDPETASKYFFPYMKDCVLKPLVESTGSQSTGAPYYGIRNNYINSHAYVDLISQGLSYSNIVNNFVVNRSSRLVSSPRYSELWYNNYFNNNETWQWLGYESTKPNIDKSEKPSYLGTGREDIVRPYIYEIGNGNTFGQIDLSNMPSRPYAEAHGIVWKIVVNGKDAQDEYEDLAPLGVGKHKFEVYFNRPMNKAVVPNILFGVRDPYTQNAVNEDGSWNEEGTIYTAYKTITGKTKSDGVNRIYVYGAEDNEYFEIPYEKSRFNIQINAAGSMATGFMAEAQMGRVSLTWNNDENDFEDAMGFNVYRYTLDDEGNADTLRLNTDIVDIETTAYTDYDVTPGETYYYMYKVLSTDLQEYDVSNVVAATPLTSTLGDANGSGDVDVADVITTVNYAAGMNPKPFIFEAADMNTDSNIDILDVVGIIQKILNPSAGAKARVESVATYTVEDGIIYVESPVDLAGVQLQLNAPEQETPEVLNTLDGFEQASAWLTDEDYLFLGYNMSGKTIPAGKHALLNIGNAQLRSIRLSDTMGGNVMAEAGNTTAIEMQTPTLTKSTHGIYNLNGQKVAGSAEDLQRLPKGVYIVDGIKVVK